MKTFGIEDKIISWAQYLQWADLNFDRYLVMDESKNDVIGSACQWFASEYVVLEGWKELKLNHDPIDSLIDEQADKVALLRRCRNAVFHYQKIPFEQRLMDFALEPAASEWLGVLHREFLIYILQYPGLNFPEECRNEQFEELFFEIIGWIPNLNKVT